MVLISYLIGGVVFIWAIIRIYLNKRRVRKLDESLDRLKQRLEMLGVDLKDD